MGEDDHGEVGGVVTLLEVEVEGEVMVIHGTSTWKSDCSEALELSRAWSGRTWIGPLDIGSP
jgi:hypothetical protein